MDNFAEIYRQQIQGSLFEYIGDKSMDSDIGLPEEYNLSSQVRKEEGSNSFRIIVSILGQLSNKLYQYANDIGPSAFLSELEPYLMQSLLSPSPSANFSSNQVSIDSSLLKLNVIVDLSF